MVFFLGGWYTPDRGFLGFSSAPPYPFGFRRDSTSPTGSTRTNLVQATSVGPFFDFDIDRVRKELVAEYQYFDGSSFTGDCLEWFPVYLDPLSGQRSPYIYAANSGNGYNDSANLKSDANTSLSAYQVSNGFRAYRRKVDLLYKPESFQIISPGYDGLYGTGGIYYTDGNNRLPGTGRTAENDNIVNFVGGVLLP